MLRIDSKFNKLDNWQISQLKQKNNPAFEGITREERELVAELAKNNGALNKPRQVRLSAIIEKMGNDSSFKNIQFMLGIAKNLKYGVKKDSLLHDHLSNPDKSAIAAQDIKQNNDWEGQLQRSIRKAIDNHHSDQKGILENRYRKVFEFSAKEESPLPRQVWLSKNPEIAKQKEVISFKNDILQSPLLQNAAKEAPETCQNIQKHLDFFLASSEVSLKEKQECLEKLAYFVTDDYQLNPTIKDKKLQVLDEVFNDLVVKTPLSECLTTKKGDQGPFGMCLAISASRKCMLHEHKVAFVNDVLEELRDSPTIELYDLTSPSRNKITVEKPVFDYSAAEKLNVRLVDASALNWMYYADLTSNSATRYMDYIGFDEEHYRLFMDSHMLKDQDSSFVPVHNLLKADIKLKKTLDSLETLMDKRASLSKDHRNIESEHAHFKMETRNQVNGIVDSLLHKSTLDQQWVNTSLINENFYHSSKEAVNDFLKLYKEEHKLNSKKSLPVRMDSYETMTKRIISQLAIRTGLEDLDTLKDHFQEAFKDYGFPKNIDIKEEELENKLETLNSNSIREQELVEKLVNILDSAENWHKDKNSLATKGLERLKNYLSEPQCIVYKDQKVYPKQSKPTQERQFANLIERFIPGIDQKDLKQELEEVVQLYDYSSKREDDYEKSRSLTGKGGTFRLQKELFKSQAFNRSRMEFKVAIPEFRREICDQYHIKPTKEDVISFINAVKKDLITVANAENLSEKDLSALSSKYNTEKTRDSLRSTLENLNQTISKEISVLDTPESLDKIASILDVLPSEKTVLDHLTTHGVIKSKSFLDRVQQEFDSRSIAKSDGRPEIQDVILPVSLKPFFKESAKAVNTLKREVTREYKHLKKDLGPELEKLYKDAGRGSGRFWVGEEGNSGLHYAMATKILTHLTGQDSYVEQDPLKALDKIEKGHPSGVSCSSMSEVRPALHAQYVYTVEKKEVELPKTGETRIERVLHHDNTWNDVETKNAWTDFLGNLRSDYGHDFGGEHGFFISEEHTEGIPESKVIKSTTSISVGNTGQTIEFPTFQNVAMPGKIDNISSVAEGLMGKLIKASHIVSDQRVKILLDKILNGNADVINKFTNALSDELIELGSKPSIINDEEKFAAVVKEKVTKHSALLPLDSLRSGNKADFIETLAEKIVDVHSKTFKTDKSPSYKKLDYIRSLERLVRNEATSNLSASVSVNSNKIDAIRMEYADKINLYLDLIDGKYNKRSIPDEYRIDSAEKFAKIPEKLDEARQNRAQITQVVNDTSHALCQLANESGTISVESLEKVYQKAILALPERARTFNDHNKAAKMIAQASSRKLNQERKPISPERMKNLILPEFSKVCSSNYMLANNCYNAMLLIKKATMNEYALDSTTFLSLNNAKTPEEINEVDKLIHEKAKNSLREYFSKTQETTTKAISLYKDNVKEALESFNKNNILNKPLTLELLAKETDLIADVNCGSSRHIKEKLSAINDAIVKSYKESTEEATPESAAALKAKLTVVLNKTMEETIPKPDLNALQNSLSGRMIIDWVDETFNPFDNKDFKRIMKKVHAMDRQEFEALLEKSTSKELGIEYEDPVSLIHKLQGKKDSSLAKLKNILFSQLYYKQLGGELTVQVDKIKEDHEKWIHTPEGENATPEERFNKLEKAINDYYKDNVSPELLYTSLKGTLLAVDIEKPIKSMKQMAINQLGVYPALPMLKAYNESSVLSSIDGNLDNITTMVKRISTLKKQEKDLLGKPALNEALQENLKAQNITLQSLVLTENGIAKAFVRPSQQDKAVHLMKEYVKELAKSVDSKATTQKKAELKAFMLDNHILRYPGELLDEIVQEGPKMVEADGLVSTDNAQILQNWGGQLLSLVQVAEKAELEFDIMQKISNGEMAQVAREIKNPDNKFLYNPRTKEDISIGSKKGLGFVLQSLSDGFNDNSTLKFFIQQAGLTDTVIDYFIKGPSPKKVLQLIHNYEKRLEEHERGNVLVDKVFETFADDMKAQYGDRLTCLSFEDTETIENELNERLEACFEAAHDSDNPMLSHYKHSLAEEMAYKRELNKEKGTLNMLECLEEFHVKMDENVDKHADEIINRIILHERIITGKSNGLTMLEELVAEYSPRKAEIEEYKIKLDDTIKKLEVEKKKLQDPILDKIEARQKELEKTAPKKNEDILKMGRTEESTSPTNNDVNLIEGLEKGVNENDQFAQTLFVKKLIDSKQESLDHELKTKLFDRDTSSLMRTMCAGILGEKGKISILLDYIDTMLDENGSLRRDVEDDQPLVLAAGNVLNNISTLPPLEEEEALNKLAKLYVESCDDKNATPLMDQLLNLFINGLPNKGEAAEDLMINIIEEPSNNINSRIVAVDILGRTDTVAFYPLFEDIVENAEDFSSSKTGQLSLVDVATKSILSLVDRYPKFDFEELPEMLQSIDINALSASAKGEDGIEGKQNADQIESTAKRVQQRIEAIQEKLSRKKRS